MERDGCPEEDKDNDGIADDQDKCPDEPEDKDKFEDEDGCPDPDNDKDGVLDEKDKCPTEAETKNGYQDDDGCPDEVPAPVKKFTGVVKGINFRRNSADIKASSFPLLKEAVSVFKEYPALRVEISGHTSNEGKRDFNMKLSRKRAEAVKLFLVSAGIDENRIGTVGYGPDKPIADNETKDGKEKNRRIEFRLLGTEEKVQTQPEPEDINPAPDRDAKPARARPRLARARTPPSRRRRQRPRRRRRQRPTAIRCRRRSPRPRKRPRRRQGRRPRRRPPPPTRPRPRKKPRKPPRASSNPVPSPREGDPVPSPREAGRGLGRGADRSAGLLRERREHGTAARIRPLVFLRVGLRRRVAAEVSVGAGDQAIDRLVARRGHGPIEVRAVNHDLEQD